MKIWVLLVFAGLFLYGCGPAATQSGFYQHDTMYKNFDHLKFSWYGYKTPAEHKAKQSQNEGWWGIEIPYVPGK